MSDDFTVCENCRIWNSLELQTKANPQLNDDGSPEDTFKCKVCGKTCIRSEIIWRHVEYKGGKVIEWG